MKYLVSHDCFDCFEVVEICWSWISWIVSLSHFGDLIWASFCGILQDNIAVCEQMLECSGALQGEAQCFWFLCTLKIGVLFFVSMPGSWLWEAPGLSFTSIVSWLENLINKSWLLDMFVRKNQSQKKNKRNLKSFQVDCDNCDHGFFWPWSVPSQGRSWGESLEWLTSKKGLGYGLEGLTTFCFFSDFVWFCLSKLQTLWAVPI